jgi:hypothetical protein
MPSVGVSRFAMSPSMSNSRVPSASGGLERHGRQRHLVGDERVVGQERRRKKALSGKAVRQSAGDKG